MKENERQGRTAGVGMVADAVGTMAMGGGEVWSAEGEWKERMEGGLLMVEEGDVCEIQ